MSTKITGLMAPAAVTMRPAIGVAVGYEHDITASGMTDAEHNQIVAAALRELAAAIEKITDIKVSVEQIGMLGFGFCAVSLPLHADVHGKDKEVSGVQTTNT